MRSAQFVYRRLLDQQRRVGTPGKLLAATASNSFEVIFHTPVKTARACILFPSMLQAQPPTLQTAPNLLIICSSIAEVNEMQVVED